MYMAQLSVAPLRREANGLGPLEIDRGHPLVVYSRANPTRNPVTDYSRPGYNINININTLGVHWAALNALTTFGHYRARPSHSQSIIALYSLPRLMGSKLVLKRPFDGSKSALKRLLNGFK